MELIKITDPFVTLNSNLYKDVTLLQGKTYLVERSHALVLAEKGLAKTVEGANRLPYFHPSELKRHSPPLKVMFLFNGGLGDAISLAYLLSALQRRYNIASSVACDAHIWDNIFMPLGHPGTRYSLPVEIDDIHNHDFIQTRADLFFKDRKEKWELCIVEELGKAYGVDINPDFIQYRLPEGMIEKQILPETRGIRVGLNFESKGRIRSYPQDLQPILIHCLLNIGFEVFLFGLKKPTLNGLEKNRHVHDYCGRTTIPELSFFLSHMDLVICTDSFIAHLSNILGTTTVVLLSTTRKGIYNWHKNILCIESKVECSPCGEVADNCPMGHRQCQAFFHESISPEVITFSVINECVTHFNQLIRASAAGKG